MTLNPFTETRLNLFKTNWQIDTAFDTLALEDGAGREQRFCRITESLTSINADGMLLNADEFNYLKAFFDARNGKYEGFRFKNELDYTLTQSPEYYSSDTTVYQQGILVQKSGLTYQILKRYHVNGTNTYKTIKKPVNGTVKVYSNGVELTSGWSVNINTGVVTFISTPSDVLTVSCEYDLPMRFDMDEDQLNHRVVENDSNFHSASDVYQVLQFVLIEDSYDKFNNYVASDFDDIDYDFIPDPLPEITKGTFTVTRIKTTQSKKEKRAIQSTGKASRKLGQNGLLDKELKTFYTLFMVAKGRKLAFNYSGQSYRFDGDIFKCTYRTFGWDFAGIDLKQSIVHEVPKVNTLCHCIKIKIKYTPKVDSTTYIIPLIDVSGSMDSAIPNIEDAIASLKTILKQQIYFTDEAVNKYVKNVIDFSHERYLLALSQDYRDNPSESAKYLFLLFQNEAGNPGSISPTEYHRVPREVENEPKSQYVTDVATFKSAYETFTNFNCLIFVPTSDPAIDYEIAFNAHIYDAVNGLNGYEALNQYKIFVETNWPIDASGSDIYQKIYQWIF